MEMDLTLNPDLDLDAIAADYARDKRRQIQNVLMPSSADALYKCLDEDTPWGIAYNRGEHVVQLRNEQLAIMPPEERAEIMRFVQKQAANEYGYIYNYYPILEAYMKGLDKGLALHQVLEFVNSPAFIEFGRKVTGLDDIVRCDSQATYFSPGNFLKQHTDYVPSEKRRAAYVINLTRDWHRDWGGYLQFFDADGNVEAAFKPIFNAVNIFTVPQDHSVSYVAPYATGKRFAITGWMRAAE